MTISYNRQAHRPPTATVDTLADEGVHTALLHDLSYDINNLARVDPGVTFLHGVRRQANPLPDAYSQGISRGWGGLSGGVTGRATFIQQGLIWVTPGSAKLAWTLGCQLTSAGGTSQLTAMTLYLAPKPYTGAADVASNAPVAFNSTNLEQYDSHTVEVVAPGSTDSGYLFVVDDLGFPIRPGAYDVGGSGVGWKAWAVLVATVTVAAGATSAQLALYDFTTWCLPE